MNALMNAQMLLPCMRLKVLLRRFCLLLKGFNGLKGLKGRPACRAAVASAADLVDADAVEDSTPRGCGWFDSSHDLQQGLRVQEHLRADSLARELPLGAWLDLQLSGWRAATPAAAQPAFTHAT